MIAAGETFSITLDTGSGPQTVSQLTSAVINTRGEIAEELKDKINALADFSAQRTGGVITISSASGGEFTVDVSISNAESTPTIDAGDVAPLIAVFDGTPLSIDGADITISGDVVEPRTAFFASAVLPEQWQRNVPAVRGNCFQLFIDGALFLAPPGTPHPDEILVDPHDGRGSRSVRFGDRVTCQRNSTEKE